MSDSHSREERRTAPREYFPTPTGEVLLWVSADTWIPALTVDVAPGGIAAAVESKWRYQFEEGFQVRVAFKNTKRLAEVTSVTEIDDRQHRVGVKWLDLDE